MMIVLSLLCAVLVPPSVCQDDILNVGAPAALPRSVRSPVQLFVSGTYVKLFVRCTSACPIRHPDFQDALFDSLVDQFRWPDRILIPDVDHRNAARAVKSLKLPSLGCLPAEFLTDDLWRWSNSNFASNGTQAESTLCSAAFLHYSRSEVQPFVDMLKAWAERDKTHRLQEALRILPCYNPLQADRLGKAVIRFEVARSDTGGISSGVYCEKYDSHTLLHANASRSVQTDGFHRDVVTRFALDIPDDTQGQCRAVVVQYLPREMYVDIYALNELHRFGAPKTVTFEDVDVERPASSSHQVATLTFLPPVHPRDVAEFVLPTHIRYQSPRSEHHISRAVLSAPEIYVRCESTSASPRHFGDWHPVDLRFPTVGEESGSGEVVLPVPVGHLEDEMMVARGTLVVTCCAAATVVSALLFVGRGTRTPQPRAKVAKGESLRPRRKISRKRL